MFTSLSLSTSWSGCYQAGVINDGAEGWTTKIGSGGWVWAKAGSKKHVWACDLGNVFWVFVKWRRWAFVLSFDFSQMTSSNGAIFLDFNLIWNGVILGLLRWIKNYMSNDSVSLNGTSLLMEGLFLLTEGNFRMWNPNFQTSRCKIQLIPNFRGVLFNLP